MTRTGSERRYWLFMTDPHDYHWDTLFVKGKEMWHGASSRPDALRQLKQVRRGDRVLCYHGAPERSLYALAEVTRDPYPDPHDAEGKNLVADYTDRISGDSAHGRDRGVTGFASSLNLLQALQRPGDVLLREEASSRMMFATKDLFYFAWKEALCGIVQRGCFSRS